MKDKLLVGILTISLIVLVGFSLNQEETQASTLANSLSGKILLQVELNGEAWYINPVDEQRYFLGRPADAFAIMRTLGLGISELDFTKFERYGANPSLAGRILLRVEANGEAYYVDPELLSVNYLGRPADAFNLMREEGLGITNENLATIPTASGYDNPEYPSTTNDPSNINEYSGFSVSSAFTDDVTVSISGNEITVMSNGLPNHDTGTFPNSGNPNTISKQDHEYTFTLNPSLTGESYFSGGVVFGIALNGIPIEPLTGEFWDNDPSSGWNLEWSTNDLGFDDNNAHVQPDGTYHYHGLPTGLLEILEAAGDTDPILLGFAADGFPIYHDHKSSSYRVKSGTRPNGPGNSYDGSYVEDYEYIEGLGDLDECNGMTGITDEYPNGTYYYVQTETFPVFSRCFSGTIDDSFRQGGGGTGTPTNNQSGPPSNSNSTPPQEGQNGGIAPPPPPEAISACSGKSENSSCSFQGMGNATVNGTCRTINSDLACAP